MTSAKASMRPGQQSPRKPARQEGRGPGNPASMRPGQQSPRKPSGASARRTARTGFNEAGATIAPETPRGGHEPTGAPAASMRPGQQSPRKRRHGGNAEKGLHASMRPGQQSPRKRACMDLKELAEKGFNEAGATIAPETAFRRCTTPQRSSGFNEAGATIAPETSSTGRPRAVRRHTLQ